jgi:transcriptional regulator with XRE-family HTH domain
MKNTESDNTHLVGQRLNDVIHSKRITKSDLARIAGVSRQSVNGWFNRGSISKEAAAKISAAVGVSLAWILGEEAEESVALSADEKKLVELYRQFPSAEQENMVAAFEMRLSELKNFYDKYIIKK